MKLIPSNILYKNTYILNFFLNNFRPMIRVLQRSLNPPDTGCKNQKIRNVPPHYRMGFFTQWLRDICKSYSISTNVKTKGTRPYQMVNGKTSVFIF